MLRALTLDGWKSFRRIPTPRPLPFAATTLLVGPNASGKSNVLDALRFLQGCALDFPLYDVLRGRSEGGRQVWTGIRGGDAEAAWMGSDSFTLTSEWEVAGERLRHTLAARTGIDVRVEQERLEKDGTSYFTADVGTADRSHNARRQFQLELMSAAVLPGVEDQLDVTKSLLGAIATIPLAPHECVTRCIQLRSMARSSLHLDLQPHLMRGPSPLQAAHMGTAGENIAAVLHRMGAEARADLLDWLSELCAPRITDMTFVEVDAVRDVYFLLEERESLRVSSRSLSDGTLRFLGILVALMTAPKGTTILLEEPDAGLHPARIHLLAQMLEQLPRQRGIQVIATTHSPTLLAHLSPQLLADVLAFDRDPASGSTLAARVGDLPTFATLRDSNDRAHLIATGWLEQAL